MATNIKDGTSILRALKNELESRIALPATIKQEVNNNINNLFTIGKQWIRSEFSSRFNFASYCKPHPKQITSFYIFGDSLSDTGNLSTSTYIATGGQFWAPPSTPLPSPNPIFGGPYYASNPKLPGAPDVLEGSTYYNSSPSLPDIQDPSTFPKVRASNGPIWVDFLPQQIGLTSEQVTNFAFSGATTGFDNGLQTFLPLPPGVQLPGLRTEIDQFTSGLSCKGADPNGIYAVWAGANDLFNLAGALPNIQPEALPSAIASVVTKGVDNIAQSIIKLAQKGAKAFLVPNLPNVGATPLLRQNNLTDLFDDITKTFNTTLADTFPKLEQQFGIDIVPADVYSLSQDILTGQGNEFTNVSDPLIAQDPNLNDMSLNPDGFFWYDYQHPTTKVHRILADLFESTLAENGYQGIGSHQDNLLESKRNSLLSFLKNSALDHLLTNELNLAKFL